MNVWNPQFRIQGQVCHLIGPLEPADEMQARFLQIYFMDVNQQIQRFSITDGLCNSILLDIQEALNQKCFCKFIVKYYNKLLKSFYSPKDIYSLLQL